MTTTKTEPAKAASTDSKAVETITLDHLCKELKINPRDARMMLRFAAKQIAQYPNLGKDHVARQPWAWAPGTKALDEARKALATTV